MEKRYIVYQHISPSGKYYIGITSSSIEKRAGDGGVNYLKKNKSCKFVHDHFARAIIKYGWNNFKHEIISDNLTKSEACAQEQFWIAFYKERGISYNNTAGGEGIRDYKFTKEQIEKLRISHTGLKQSGETVAKRAAHNTGKIRTNEQKQKTSKAVLQIDTQTEVVIAKFFGAREAGRVTGINSSHIVDCCNRKPSRMTAGGYKWRWATS